MEAPSTNDRSFRYGKVAHWHFEFCGIGYALLEHAEAVTFQIVNCDIWPSSSLIVSYKAIALHHFGCTDDEQLTFTTGQHDLLMEVICLATMSGWDAIVEVPGRLKFELSHDEYFVVSQLGDCSLELLTAVEHFLKE